MCQPQASLTPSPTWSSPHQMLLRMIKTLREKFNFPIFYKRFCDFFFFFCLLVLFFWINSVIIFLMQFLDYKIPLNADKVTQLS